MTKWAKNTLINDWSVITRTLSIRPFFRERTEETIISSRFVWIFNCSFTYRLVRYGLYCAEVNEHQICKWTFSSYCWYIVTFVFFCVDTKKTNKRHLWIWSCRGWGQGVWLDWKLNFRLFSAFCAFVWYCDHNRMPHLLSDMAEYHRENTKQAAKSRKAIAARKGSPRCGAKGCGSPPGRVFYRQDYIEALTYNPTNIATARLWEKLVDSAHRLQMDELQNGCAGQSPPKVDHSGSGTGFQQAPAPAFLPRPPTEWMVADIEEDVTDACNDITEDVGSAMSNQLKMLLKVQGWHVSVQYYVCKLFILSNIFVGIQLLHPTPS